MISDKANKYVQFKKLVDKCQQSKWKTFLDGVGERRVKNFFPHSNINVFYIYKFYI